MIICGIICEYNPFHNGHLYQIKKIRSIFGEDCGVIAIMSGSFVQRGEGAIMDKWSRAETAIKAGNVNVVIELPAFYATSSAELFSSGAVSLAAATGVCDYLVFGSESPGIDTLKNIAGVLADEPVDFKFNLKKNLKAGLSYPASVSEALKESNPELEAEKYLSGSNNILGIEYIKAIYRQNIQKPKPYAILRQGQDYLDSSVPEDMTFRSASSIRRHIKQSGASLSGVLDGLYNSMPSASLSALTEELKNKKCITNQEVFAPAILSGLISGSNEYIASFYGMDEGLGNRLKKYARLSVCKNSLLEDLIDKSSTKRYPKSRVNRALIHMLLGIKKQDFELFEKNPYTGYIRVLGFDKKGQYILKKMRKKATLPVYMKGSDFLEIKKTTENKALLRMAEIDVTATDIRSIASEGVCGLDFTTPPIAFLKRPRQ